MLLINPVPIALLEPRWLICLSARLAALIIERPSLLDSEFSVLMARDRSFQLHYRVIRTLLQ